MSRDWCKGADTCGESVPITNEYYSVDTVAKLLLPTGLLLNKSTQYVGSFEKYVFLVGNKEEIYNKQEIEFISSVGDIAIFTEFYKETKKGFIPCKVITTQNRKQDALKFSIAFTKIINKASDGFNICVVFSEEGIIFTCRAYDSSANDYYISDIIKTYNQMEEISDVLMYSSDYDGFVKYYSYVRDAIRYKDVVAEYPPRNRILQRTAYDYMDALWELEHDTGLSFAVAIDRCFCGLEEQYEETYANRVSEAEEYLFNIESSRINTMEMLFEAEEMEKLALETEQHNNTIIMQNNDEVDNSAKELDADTKALLDDPESMIRLLKKRRGI